MQPTITIPVNILFVPAVYGLKRNGEYLYIGCSVELVQRLQHLQRKFVLLPTDELDIWYCLDGGLLSLELQLIQIHKPSYNITGIPKVERDKRKLVPLPKRRKSAPMREGSISFNPE